ncbi:MAG: HindIII family type II restriction endonuclease [Lachnospiraceae bacterium]|nr:HindIII family type II restriction endonuclease [Lachnospiraceae bacterium]MDY4096556.1 HindIII family type II restriction endonuclease [Lachnospiraceae bacterium]
MEKHYFFLLQEIVDDAFNKYSSIDHDLISANFQTKLQKEFSDDQLADLLIYSGYIPDLYDNDSSQETLFSKLVEVLVCEWARRMGFTSRFIKQKASYEDVNITIDGKVLVCDAKSFRLGRSQKAPNVKDFLKLEDIRKWLARYSNKLGGLVTYPCTHEWSSSSDAYQYCSDKSAPTVMLPYKYLSFLLKNKNKYNTKDLSKLWDYNRIFPTALQKKMQGGNRNAYWLKIDAEIVRITNTSSQELKTYISAADKLIRECILANLAILEKNKSDIIADINKSVNSETDINKLKREIIDYKTAAETGTLTDLISRINNFRL